MRRTKQQPVSEKTQEQYIKELEEYAASLKAMVETPKQELTPVLVAKPAWLSTIKWGDVVPWVLFAIVAGYFFVNKLKTDPEPTPTPSPSSWQVVETYYPTIVKRHKETYKQAADGIRSGLLKSDKDLHKFLTDGFSANRETLDKDLDVWFDAGLLRNDDGAFEGEKNFKEPAAKFLETIADRL